MARKPKKPQEVDTLRHSEAKRTNIPTAEYQSVMRDEDKTPVQVAYERRNRDLDPQLVWRGKDEQDWSDLVINAPPLYIQETVHPKVLIDDLVRQSQLRQAEQPGEIPDLFADLHGLDDPQKATEFYQHDLNWTNRMILGDSLQVMASLAEREGLRGKVQCIYLDPPYGIKFNSNFQWSTTSRDVKDGNRDHITREPEQTKAFRDTWRDGIHSYLTNLRDRLTVCRDLLADSGSIFVQIGDENVHRVRAVMDEVFGEDNFLVTINFVTTSGFPSKTLTRVGDMILWYSKKAEYTKYRQLFMSKNPGDDSSREYKWLMLADGATRPLTDSEYNGLSPLPDGSKRWRYGPLTSSGASEGGTVDFKFQQRIFHPGKSNHWKVRTEGLRRLDKAGLLLARRNSISYYLFAENYPIVPITNVWNDTKWGFDASDKRYVVETNSKVVEKCVLMATDPGDLILDPTCGSGTTAYVAEQWGRRWITMDTSRVALALARARLMGARYAYYLLSDSPEGQRKEAEVTRTAPSTAPTHGDIRQGFVYERVPHITLKSIANNAEIDVIWEQHQPRVEQALANLNAALKGHAKPFKVTTGGRAGKSIDFTVNGTVKLPSGEDAPADALLEWEVPREAPTDWPAAAAPPLAEFWETRIARQREIDASIAAKADHEYLYDKPYVDKSKVRVSGPFTVESLSPHRVLTVDENDELIDPAASQEADAADFAQMVLDHLETAGVQQARKDSRIRFTSITGWPGKFIGAEGRYLEGEDGPEKRAGIFIGPEFGTVSRPDLVAAAREAADASFDVLIACAFNFDAHTTEFNQLGWIPVLKARMNADLHMADDLKNTGAGNLFVIFGEPDIDIEDADNGQVRIRINGVDVFHPQTGEIVSSGADDIALWFIDTDYNEECFFVRHAYFLGANDPYKALKTTLKAEIDQDAWESLYSDVSRPFDKPKSGRIAVKVINHLGDEVMKVFRV